MAETYQIPGVYNRPQPRAEGFPRVRSDVAGFVGILGPRHVDNAVAVEDWQGFVAEFRTDASGGTIEPPAGSVMDKAVRDFFANGGRRLWIVNIAETLDGYSSDRMLNRMLGIDTPDEQHGLELLLRQHEVSIVALPDLDAQITASQDTYDPPPDTGNPCFGPCDRRETAGAVAAHKARAQTSFGRLFPTDKTLWAQQYLLSRLERVRWRWFAVIAPPAGLTLSRAIDWRQKLTKTMGGSDLGALYWPWVRVQDSPDAPTELRSPVGGVTGIFAATDVADGPHMAPANRPLIGVVGLETEITDRENARAYEAGINLLRGFPGRGTLVWGARTLRWQGPLDLADPLAFVNARRCLSAIARSCEVVGQPLVFEPNTALLRIKLHQLMVDYLLRVFATGALMGAQPEEGFFVRVLEVEDSPEGHLECEIGVALAHPSEFIEFRLGRDGGVVENAEAA